MAVSCGPESCAQSGLSVHSSTSWAFLAPMLNRSLSVVERSAPMPLSSCPVDLNPRAARGSFSIIRSVLFWLHSRIEANIGILPGLNAESLSRCSRLEDVTTCPVRLTLSNARPGWCRRLAQSGPWRCPLWCRRSEWIRHGKFDSWDTPWMPKGLPMWRASVV